MSFARMRMMSARLPTVSEPVTSPSPSALAPLMVAISITSWKPTGGRLSDGVPFHGMPMFQVKRIVSNMLGGAIEVASKDREHAGFAHAQQRHARISGEPEAEFRQR